MLDEKISLSFTQVKKIWRTAVLTKDGLIVGKLFLTQVEKYTDYFRSVEYWQKLCIEYFIRIF